jgi:fucose 4-O-acetylase-like acetyltransferase
MSLDELVARTPDTRDRYVDFLRATSIVAVVFGHWFIGIIWWHHGIISDTSAIGLTSWLWVATWFLQVMPIFFFVGGFSNMVTFRSYERRGESSWAFVKSRLVRLLRPSLVFLGVWTAVQVALHLADIGAPAGIRLWGDTRMLRGVLPPAATIPFGPLWFLAVYLIIVCIAPVTIRLHRRFGIRVPIVFVVATVLIDVVGFGFGHPGLRYLNIVPVLLLPHQLGHFYADGTLTRQPRRVFVAMAAAGLAGLILLTNPWIFEPFADRYRWFPGIGYYPKSLLGTDVEPFSNAYPPTVCFMLAGIWVIGLAMLLRPAVSRWLDRAGPWRAVINTNGVIMTLFLWHMTAYLVAILILWPLGFGHEHDSTARWWLERPLWELGPGLILLGIVMAVGRFERPKRLRTPAASPVHAEVRPT